NAGLFDPPEKSPPFRTGPSYAGRTWAVVCVDMAALSGKVKRLNITLPERVLRRIDAAAGRTGESRSGFLARIALAAV
ncbi:MAG: type II toxin-antitoxin system HicB family antitoxin, partial [Chthoniobacterales bacterium]|nr:type II toxin-antitoxin system HicB family antitoxin [Chthoniobacterales bacterium]